jgi:hypothetical protein
VPPILPSDGADAARSIDEQFLELLLAHEDLLRAEFDEIITREWPGSPPDRPGSGVRPRYPEETRRRVPAAGLPGQPRRPCVRSWPRQRAPPEGQMHQPATKRGR